jgi:hypothetical protein
MNYQHKLTPWVIHKLLPDLNQLTVSRFRRRNDAEAYLKVLKQMQPNARFAIAFDFDQAGYATQVK